jgi:hypothetical protein
MAKVPYLDLRYNLVVPVQQPPTSSKPSLRPKTNCERWFEKKHLPGQQRDVVATDQDIAGRAQMGLVPI